MHARLWGAGRRPGAFGGVGGFASFFLCETEAPEEEELAPRFPCAHVPGCGGQGATDRFSETEACFFSSRFALLCGQRRPRAMMTWVPASGCSAGCGKVESHSTIFFRWRPVLLAVLRKRTRRLCARCLRHVARVVAIGVLLLEGDRRLRWRWRPFQMSAFVRRLERVSLLVDVVADGQQVGARVGE